MDRRAFGALAPEQGFRVPEAKTGGVSEGWIIAIVGAVQFVNILDFMMVMPLGPDFARALHIEAGLIGIVGGTYTAAAAAGGLLGAGILDRLDRRTALGLAMFGLAIGTLSGALATSFWTLLLARAVAGVFGGPATSVALSIIADVVPPERRGRAMSRVMVAFSAASVLGVPGGLEIARIGGWRAPFVVVAAASAVITTVALWRLPSMRGHMVDSAKRVPLRALFWNPRVLLAYAIVGGTTLAAFALIPNISAHLQLNLHYPRASLGWLYMAGGLVSFGVMQGVGRLVDRFGSAQISLFGIVGFCAVVWAGFVDNAAHLPVLAVFILFMAMQTTRNVSLQTLISKVPGPHERAGFMSLQSAVQHLASASGAFASSAFLLERNGRLEGVEDVAWFTIVMSLMTAPLFFWLEAGIRRRTQPASPTSLPQGTPP